MITGMIAGDVVGEGMAFPKLGAVADLGGEEWWGVLWRVLLVMVVLNKVKESESLMVFGVCSGINRDEGGRR